LRFQRPEKDLPISKYLTGLREKVGTELLQVPSVAALIRDSNERILFAKDRESGLWGLPAGAIDPGETPEEAVRREVAEETGLQIEPLEINGVFGGKEFRYAYSNGDRVEYLIVVFECAIVGGTLRNADREVSLLKFFDEDKKPRLSLPYPPSIF
jgi:ADP-ribose pyrophosphatase YjhB (NUDIX family)